MDQKERYQNYYHTWAKILKVYLLISAIIVLIVWYLKMRELPRIAALLLAVGVIIDRGIGLKYGFYHAKRSLLTGKNSMRFNLAWILFVLTMVITVFLGQSANLPYYGSVWISAGMLLYWSINRLIRKK